MKLKEARKAAGLTQAGLSELSGVSARQIQRIEAGEQRPNRGTAEALARTLNYYITGGVGEGLPPVSASGLREAVEAPAKERRGRPRGSSRWQRAGVEEDTKAGEDEGWPSQFVLHFSPLKPCLIIIDEERGFACAADATWGIVYRMPLVGFVLQPVCDAHAGEMWREAARREDEAASWAGAAEALEYDTIQSEIEEQDER